MEGLNKLCRMQESKPFASDIPPDSNTKYTGELLIVIHSSLCRSEVRIQSLAEQTLYSSVELSGYEERKASSPKVKENNH